MKNTDFNIIEKYIQEWVENNRPSKEIRDEVDYSYEFDKGVFILFEIRLLFDGDRVSFPVVKASFVKKTNTWKLYWMRSNNKWCLYEPNTKMNTIFDVFREIDKDQYGCFFG